jgi:hypothetical protein
MGIMMLDLLGTLRYCFTPLAGYIVDTPKAQMLAAVGGKTLLVTMAMFKQFRDPFQHEPHTAFTTLAQLHAIKSIVDLSDVEQYVKEALKHCLNGVHEPFWRDWPMAEPSKFLMPELLHHCHKAFWDHDIKWCIRVLGGMELDFRFSIL